MYCCSYNSATFFAKYIKIFNFIIILYNPLYNYVLQTHNASSVCIVVTILQLKLLYIYYYFYTKCLYGFYRCSYPAAKIYTIFNIIFINHFNSIYNYVPQTNNCFHALINVAIMPLQFALHPTILLLFFINLITISYLKFTIPIQYVLPELHGRYNFC